MCSFAARDPKSLKGRERSPLRDQKGTFGIDIKIKKRF